METIYVKKMVLNMMIQGDKEIDIRPKGRVRVPVEVGQEVLFACFSQSLRVTIVAIRTYPTLTALLEAEDLARIAPGDTTDGIQKRMQKAYGDNVTSCEAVAVEFKKCP